MLTGKKESYFFGCLFFVLRSRVVFCLLTVFFCNTVSTCYFHLLTYYAPYLIMKDDNELEREEPQPYYFNLCSEGNSLTK